MSRTPLIEQGAKPERASAVSPAEFAIGGMTCNNCARHVTEAIQGVTGVANVNVQLEAGHATVRWQPDARPNETAVVQAVQAAGYSARVIDEESCHTDRPTWSPLAGWRFNVVVGLICTVPLIAGEWVFQLGMARWFQWLAFVLALPVQFLCGARFYRGAWNQLKIASSNMDTLVALGSTTAFAYSVWGLFAGWSAHLYFMEAAAIITLISVGHWLESIVSTKAASSLQALLNLAPATARRLDPFRSQRSQEKPIKSDIRNLKFEANQNLLKSAAMVEKEVPVAELKIGDWVVLRPGDRVPIDGVVLEGNSAVDESMLTGESLPIDKEPGAKLYTGTVNQNGRLVMRVNATGEATALAQIIAVVQRAQNSRANIQKLGDRVSSVFVPIVVLVALGTGLWWGLAYDSAARVSQTLAPFLWPIHLPVTALAAAFIQAAAVLIVACPCAMGLATPVAIMAGTNVAARRGILIRDGAALEKTGRLTAVLFDKTGTLTQGKLAVSAVEDCRNESKRSSSVEQMAAALARPSNHPLSKAVAKLADGEIVFSDWQEVRGAGVQGTMKNAGHAVRSGESTSILRLGSLNWLRECGVNLSAATRLADNWSAQGATILGLAANDRLIGLLALRDTIKSHAAEVVAQLTRQSKTTYLITGDNKLTAMAIAKQVGIPPENVFSEIRPEQKAEIVKQLQQRGERVAFVGDGINDAPALEQSDLGIAVSQASDVAREAADIILLKSEIQAIPEALGLAQATLRTIKQNLFWAFFYNAAAIPLAVLGFLSPVLCAAAMGLSDLIVIGNALRLRRWKV